MILFVLCVGQRVGLWRLEIHTAMHVSFHVKRSLCLILTKAGQFHLKFHVNTFYEGLFSVSSSAVVCMWIDKEILIDYNRNAYVSENTNSESKENAY
jgi:hypothetical protein